MTEETIIDGVDVAGCGFRHKETGEQCHIALAFSGDYGNCWHCEQIPNCYYKQLKRLQEKYDSLTNKFFNSETDKTRLEQENLILKEKVQIAQNSDKKTVEILQENIHLKEQLSANPLFTDSWNNRLRADKYKQALQKIKDYALTIYNEPQISGSVIRNRNALWNIANRMCEVLDE